MMGEPGEMGKNAIYYRVWYIISKIRLSTITFLELESNMILQVHTPAYPLHKFVDHFIYFEGFNPIHSMDRFLPDGNSEFIINLTDNPQYIYENETLTELQSFGHAWVSGVRTQPITIPSGRGNRMLIVAFKKGKAHPFYDFPMSELADLVVDAGLIFGNKLHNLREQLLNTPSIHQMFLLIEKFLLAQAGDSLHANTPSQCVEYAVSNIMNQPNILGFQQLSSQIGYSQKHFIDLFKKQVGVPPKQYLKIMRFQRAISEIENKQLVQWSSVAMESGFYDQAHFINDFKSFSGFTPNEYMKRKSESLNYVPVG
jgi:AraC-like DNA-binding protein